MGPGRFVQLFLRILKGQFFKSVDLHQKSIKITCSLHETKKGMVRKVSSKWGAVEGGAKARNTRRQLGAISLAHAGRATMAQLSFPDTRGISSCSAFLPPSCVVGLRQVFVRLPACLFPLVNTVLNRKQAFAFGPPGYWIANRLDTS